MWRPPRPAVTTSFSGAKSVNHHEDQIAFLDSPVPGPGSRKWCPCAPHGSKQRPVSWLAYAAGQLNCDPEVFPMTFPEARDTVLALLRQKGRVRNSEMLALLGGDTALLEKIREDLLFTEVAEDVRGAGLRHTETNLPVRSDEGTDPVKIFLSYGRRDASDLADRLERDLQASGYQIWRDTHEINPGAGWQEEITEGLQSAEIVVVLLTPHSTRNSRTASNREAVDSVCLGEIAYALFQPPAQPVIPVMAETCEPPLAIFHLDYIDLRRWQDSSEQYQAGFDRLLDGIAAARRREKRYRSWHHLLDPFDFAPFLHSKRVGFTGRQWLFDAIDDWRTKGNSGKILLLKGDPGTGKSSVVAELVHRNPGGQVLAYHCCQWDVNDSLEPWRFVRSIAAMVAGKLEDFAALLGDPNLREILSEESCRRDPASAFERGLLAPLKRLPPPDNGPRYVLIDALDESLSLPPGQPHLVGLLASRLDRLPSWLRILATTRKEPAVLDLLKGLRAEELEAQSLDNLADLHQYIQARLEQAPLSGLVRETGDSPELLGCRLMEMSEGNFLYARQALDGLVEGVYSLSKLDQLPPGLGGLYSQRFVHLFPDSASFAQSASLLEVISAAQEPLEVTLIAASSGLEEESLLPRVLGKLSAYIPKRPAQDGPVRYAVYHKSFSEWITAPERAGQLHWVPVKQGHRKLADLGWHEYQSGAASMSRYTLRHTAQHLHAVGRWHDLVTYLTDLRVLDVRIRAGQIFEVVKDCKTTLAALPEFEAEARLEERSSRACADYGHALIAYASGSQKEGTGESPAFPAPPATGDYLDGEEIFKPLSPMAARLHLICTFTTQNASLLAAFPESFLPLVANATDGALSAEAARLSDSSRGPWLSRCYRPSSPPIRPQCLQTLHGHTSEVLGISVIPDGGCAISGSGDKSLRVWDLLSGQCRGIFRGHQAAVTCVDITPDGRYAVSGSEDSSVRLWDLIAGKCIAKLLKHMDWVTSLRITPDGRIAVSGSEDKCLVLWDLSRKNCQNVLQGHTDAISCVEITPDGHLAVSGSWDKSLRVWDLQEGRCLRTLQGHAQRVSSVAVTPDGRLAISGSHDHTIRIWNLRTGECRQVLHGHTDRVTSVSLTPDGRLAVSGSHDHTLRTWDLATGKCLRTLHGHREPVTSVNLVADGRKAVSGSEDRTLRVWDLCGVESAHSLQAHAKDTAILKISGDGRRAVSGSRDNTLRVWDLSCGRCLFTLQGHEDSITSVNLTSDGNWAVSGSGDATLLVWDLSRGICLHKLRGHLDSVTCVSVTPDSRYAVSGSLDRTLRVWDLDSGECLHILEGMQREITFLRLSSTGEFAVCGGGDETLWIWNLQHGRLCKSLIGHTDYVTCAAITSDGSLALSGGLDESLRVWDLKDERCLLTLQAHTHWVTGVSLTPDGSRAVSYGHDNTLRVWDFPQGTCLFNLQGHTDPVTCSSFTADGRHVVSGSSDNTLRVWDLLTGKCLSIYHAGSPVLSLDISRANGSILCGTQDGQVHFLTLRHGLEVEKLD